MNLKYLLIVLLLCCNVVVQADKGDDVWRAYVTTFMSQNADFTAIASEVSEDFQIVLSNCNKRFQILDRDYYISWVEEANNETIDESKILLQLQDVDYLIFGEIVYNKLKQKYTIEYAFEEVNTGHILFIDHLVFDNIEALEDREKRYDLITKRLMKECELCQSNARVVKSNMVDIKTSVKHELLDNDNDGVPDLIDEEKDTPEGALVNSRGRAYTKVELDINTKNKPKEKTEEEEKQDEMDALLIQMMPDMPSIPFLQHSNRIEEEALTQLHQIAKVMEMYPAIRVIVKGNTIETSQMMAYQRSYNTITYLMKHYDIPQKRLILAYGESKEDTAHAVMFDVTLKENVADMNEPSW
ncbi:MAG: hypothetical protein AB8G11_00685 [Saprospiraceae bacterium]